MSMEETIMTLVVKSGQARSAAYEALGEANRLYLERNKVEGWATDLSWLKDNFGISPPFGC